MHKLILLISVLFASVTFVQLANAQTKAQCNFEWRVCKAGDPANYADQCFYPSAACHERADKDITPARSACYKEYQSCIYNNCGSYSDKEIVPCARRCLRAEQACQRAAAKPRTQPQPKYTQDPAIGSARILKRTDAPTGMECRREGGTEYTERGQEKCLSPNGKIWNIRPKTRSECEAERNGTAKNNFSQTGSIFTRECRDMLHSENQEFDELSYGSSYKPPTKTEKNNTIRKQQGADLETMKAVSELGQRNAAKCVGARADADGRIEVQNICGNAVRFGFCYTDWVPNPNMASSSNPFTCDTTGKIAWGGADWVSGSDSWRAPLQAGSKSRKLIFGPCMAEVNYNGRTYSYIHSKRTSAAFRGGMGTYKCIYSKSGG